MFSTKNLPQVAILKILKFFFRKKHHLFPQKKQRLKLLRNYTIPVALYGKFAEEAWTIIILSVNSIGRHWVKKPPVWLDDFPRMCNMAENINVNFKKQARLLEHTHFKPWFSENTWTFLLWKILPSYNNKSNSRSWGKEKCNIIIF